jgi:hypothetical protein
MIPGSVVSILLPKASNVAVVVFPSSILVVVNPE